MSAEAEVLRAALNKIAAIPNRAVGADWEEIEEARAIADAALYGDGNPAEALKYCPTCHTGYPEYGFGAGYLAARGCCESCAPASLAESSTSVPSRGVGEGYRLTAAEMDAIFTPARFARPRRRDSA
ncbi:hypothetical protein ACOTHJ_13035 [Achromobacter xylosoxidans]|uniref:hypothetical protein n=1 Tax=Achromobacter anxifer TaxID=1287737 RepID=UPI00155C7556|nr:hypothetical protein [Achromobacter anxifer]CAB5514617.1 hypothetical protein LMG26857_03676 [Achromobacter anxifer]